MDLKKLYGLNYNYKKNNPWLFLNDRYRYVKTVRGLIYSKIFNNYSNFNPIVLTDKTKYEKNHIFSKSKIKIISLRKKLSLKLIKVYISVFIHIIIFYIKIITKKNKAEWLINDYKLFDIHIGDFIYDYYIRYNHEYLKPNLFSYKFLKVLFDAIYKLNFIDQSYSIYKPKMIITTSRGYTSIGNLLIRYGTKNKIKTLFTGYNFHHFYKTYNETFDHIYNVTKKKLEFCNKNISKKTINNFVKKRLIGKSYGFFVARKTLDKAYNKSIDDKFISRLKLEKKNKKIIVFAVNCFSDTPHACGRLVFNDYYDQFISTIDFINKNKSSKYFWIIKPHPARGVYGENGIVENYVKKFNFKNVILCTPKISNNLLFQYTDYLITTRSTIALEFACFGKKTILGGDAPYYFKELFLKPKNKDKYFSYLKNLEKINFSLNKNQRWLAKKILYILEFKTNVTLPSSKFLPNPIGRPKLDIEKYYIKQLKENLKNNKKTLNYNDFKNDKFYKELKKELIKFSSENRNI